MNKDTLQAIVYVSGMIMVLGLFSILATCEVAQKEMYWKHKSEVGCDE